MNINRKIFFDDVRVALFNGRLNQVQVVGIDAILDEWEERQLTDLRWLAYMFATVKWETAHTMAPIAEYGLGYMHDYGVPDKETGHAYYGRGLVQLTWKLNYDKMSRLLGVDLVHHPEKALEMEIAVQIMFEGMLKEESGIGDFTGVSLERYFNDTIEDWWNARRVINGTDKATEIAELGRAFYKALKEATQITQMTDAVHCS